MSLTEFHPNNSWSPSIRQCNYTLLIQSLNSSCHIFSTPILMVGEQFCASTYETLCLQNFGKPAQLAHTNGNGYRPTQMEIWGYGILSVCVIALSSVFGVVLLSVMKSESFAKILMGMIGLAVSCLSGSAIFHMIPQALSVPGETTEELEGYLFKSVVILAAMYLFFITERLMKLFSDHRKRVRTRAETKAHRVENWNGSAENSGRKLMNGSATEKPVHRHSLQVEDLACHGHDHQVDPEYAKAHPVKTVAWMVLTGDGIVDGLGMGAAYTISPLRGISIAIAVLCEELPHELGDLAVLLNSGMSLKRALLCNFLSACTCFIGLVVGIFLGEMEQASTWIFAIAGGMFLYISLVNMLPELTPAFEEASGRSVKSGAAMLAVQNVGLLVGFGIMFVLARFGKDMFSLE